MIKWVTTKSSSWNYKKCRCTRVSMDAEEALDKALEQWAEDVSMQAVKFAKHAGRKTVKASDIEMAVKNKG